MPPLDFHSRLSKPPSLVAAVGAGHGGAAFDDSNDSAKFITGR
jgi:hypothetical protein